MGHHDTFQASQCFSGAAGWISSPLAPLSIPLNGLSEFFTYPIDAFEVLLPDVSQVITKCFNDLTGPPSSKAPDTNNEGYQVLTHTIIQPCREHLQLTGITVDPHNLTYPPEELNKP